jgi:hypothetical protein
MKKYVKNLMYLINTSCLRWTYSWFIALIYTTRFNTKEFYILLTNAFMCFEWIIEERAITYLNSIQ